MKKLAIYVANGNLDRLGRRREWNAFEKEVENTRLTIHERIGRDAPLEEIIATLKERDPVMRKFAVSYIGGQPIEVSPELFAQMTQNEHVDHITRRHLHQSSRRQMETTRCMVPLWEMVYDYAQSQGYNPSQVDNMLFERVA